MFKKVVTIGPVGPTADAEKELRLYAGEVCMCHDISGDDREIIHRIEGEGGVFVSYTSKISVHVIESCPSIRYIGMRYSLYFEESASVGTACARKDGITVLGIRDCGDWGVVEFAINGPVRFLHRYDRPLFGDMPIGVTDLKVGIMGIDASEGVIVDAMRFMGADVSYYSRTRKAERKSQGMTYRPLKELLECSGVVFACLSKNMILLHRKGFKQLGMRKLPFNAPIGPASDISVLDEWLDQEGNYLICNTGDALGDPAGELLKCPRAVRAHGPAGRIKQASDLLSRKVLDNLRTFLNA